MKKMKEIKLSVISAKKKNENDENNQGEEFNIDDEIVIGITKPKDKETGNKKEKKKKKKRKETKKQNNTPKKKRGIIKFIILFIIIIGTIVALMLSPIFDIKNITVNGNSKISYDEITSLSGIKLDENIFKIRKGQVRDNIKENPYIEEVNIERKLPSEIVINITERTATFMIENVNGFVYINNQGYMLEISTEKLQIPVLSGIETKSEDLKAGGRLCKEDLQKLETVLKIMETANNYEIGTLINGINIVDKNNFTLYLNEEKKTVYIGDASNINTRMMYLKMILEKEKGIESEIFIKGDLNKTDVYTREKV